MKSNVGGVDRVLRIGLGLGLLSILFLVPGDARWFGLLGLVPLLTGLMGWCPLYPLFGVNTCPMRSR